MQIIPMRSLPAYSFEIDLDGKVYRLQTKWNSRGEFWTLDILTRAGAVIIQGVKMIINFELIRRYANEALPGGAIVPVDTTGKLARIGRDDLGSSVQLVYIPRSELDELI